METMMNSIATVDTMDQKSKLLFALMQLENIASLVQGNEYEQFINSHLISIDVELKRQLTNLNHSSKIKE